MSFHEAAVEVQIRLPTLLARTVGKFNTSELKRQRKTPREQLK